MADSSSAHTHPQSRADLLKIQPHLKSLNSRHFSLNSSLEDDISFALYGASSTNSATAGGSPSLSVSDPSVPVSNGKKSEKITINTLKKFYRQNKPITMVTAYDYPTAQIADSAGVICIFLCVNVCFFISLSRSHLTVDM